MVKREVLEAVRDITELIHELVEFGYVTRFCDLSLKKFDSGWDYFLTFEEDENFFPEKGKRFVSVLKSARYFKIESCSDLTDEDPDSTLFKISLRREYFDSPFFTLVFRINGEGRVSFEEES